MAATTQVTISAIQFLYLCSLFCIGAALCLLAIGCCGEPLMPAPLSAR